MSTRKGRSHSSHSNDRSRENSRDSKKTGKTRKEKMSNQRSPSKERRNNSRDNREAYDPRDNREGYHGSHDNREGYHGRSYNEVPPWQGQFRPPPSPRHMYPPPSLMGPPPRMFHPGPPNRFQIPGRMYNDFGVRNFQGYHHEFGYETYGGPPGPQSGPPNPRFGENVLEKAENMVNDMAEKRKQAEDRNRKKKNDGERSRTGEKFARPEPKRDVSQRSTDGKSPRLTTHSWSMVTKDLPCKPSTSAGVSREVSPNRAKPTAKPDATKVASKSESLSRASIAKLINAPRSHKERQRLASLVKKTKPKTLRPKLNVHAVPEVGSIDNNSPVEVDDILNLVELPENLRLQVENLLENGPDSSLTNRSPTKSPVAKKAKKDYITVEDLQLTLDSDSASVISQCEPVRIKREKNWDSDSVISDVTSIGQSEDDRKPFERLVGRVTSDPKLNRILGSDDTPSESDLLDTPEIDKMVHEALGTTPAKKDSKKKKDVFKKPESRLKSPRSAATKTNTVTSTRKKKEPATEKRSEDLSVEKVISQVTGSLVTLQTEPTQPRPEKANPRVNSPARNRVQQSPGASPSGDPHALVNSAKDTNVSKPSTSTQAEPPNPHTLSSAANHFALGKMRLRDFGDQIMGLHVAIHTPAKQEDTVNLVLEITEREEQLSSELTAMDGHAEILNALISDSRAELDRLMRLREQVNGDGEILRKQRLDILRNAVSRQKEQNVSSTQIVTSTSETRDEDADYCSVMTESAENTPRLAELTPISDEMTPRSDDWTPRSDELTPRNAEFTPRSDEDTPRVDETDAPDVCERSIPNDCTMQYVGSMSLVDLQGRNILQNLHKQSSISEENLPSTSFDKEMFKKLGPTLMGELVVPKIEPLELEDLEDPPSPGPSNKRKRKKPKLNVKMNFASPKAKKQTNFMDKLSGKDSKKKKQQQNVFLELCKELSPVDSSLRSKKPRGIRFNLGEDKQSDSLTESELDTARTDDVTNDGTDVTNDESELDSPQKVKNRLLKAVDDPDLKTREKLRVTKLKKELLKSLDEKFASSAPVLPEAESQNQETLVQSSILDHEIAMKLHQCSVALNQLQESKKKAAEIKAAEKAALQKPSKSVTSSQVTSQEAADSVSVVSDNVTVSDVTSSSTTRRRKPRKRAESKHKSQTETSSNSEYDTDDIVSRNIRSKKNIPQPKFPSDARKEKLREIGVILSASELSEYCKEGHEISASDRDSYTIETARTEDLLIDTPRTADTDTLDTARTEDLLKPISHRPETGTSMTTPFDESENYSSCLESIEDDIPLASTAESFAISLPISTQAESLSEGELPDLVLPTEEAASAMQDSDYESRSAEKHESERSKETEETQGLLLTDRSEKSVASTMSMGSVVSEETSKRYEKRIRELLNEETTEGEMEADDIEVLAVKHETPENEVMIIGETSGTQNFAEPVSARSDKSSLPGYGHDKRKFKGHSSAVTSMVIHGKYMYTCSPQDSIIQKFDLETAECVHVFRGETQSIYTMLALDFGERSFLYTGGYDFKLVKYDLDTHECLESQTLSAKVRCLVSKWDRVYIGLCSGEILSLSPENETCKSLVGSGKSVSCMDTGIEGSRHVLVVGSFDPLIAIHDAKNGLLLRTINSHARVPLSVKTFHNIIFSAGADKCIKQHDLNSGEELRSIQLHHPVTDLLLHAGNLYVACFDGLIRCFTKDLDLQRLYYGAGKNYLLRLGVNDGQLYSTNKNGHVESMPIVENLFMCQSKNCRLGFGLVGDLEYHVTEKHVTSRLDKSVPVYYCTWIGCCFETQKRMDLENHLLNHVENLACEEVD